jgi:GNAT superfamily N-acetyltransferase
MWQLASAAHDDAIAAMFLALYTEDPGEPVTDEQLRQTLAAFRAEPVRGRALVAAVDDAPVGYALLVSFWSTEYAGEICTIDELYVVKKLRSQGIATQLIERLPGDRTLWPRRPVALQLEVTPGNGRARALYERLGFRAKNHLLRRPVPPA